MGEPVNVVRMTISVLRTLKARMEAVKEPVNWSAVAAQAFEAKLLELDSKKKVGSREDVIARLKADEELEHKEDYQAGFAAGEYWAKQFARTSQLRRLAKYIEGYASKHEEWFRVSNPSEFAEAVHGLDPLLGDDEFDDEDWWADALDPLGIEYGYERVQNADFFRGFGEGAAALWEKVKDNL